MHDENAADTTDAILLRTGDEASDKEDEEFNAEKSWMPHMFKKKPSSGHEPFQSHFEKTHARALVNLCELLLGARNDLAAQIELSLRIKGRDLLHNLYRAYQLPSDLVAAVNVGKALLPLVAEGHDLYRSQLSEHLSQLCFMKTSIFLATGNVVDIDDAVLFGRDAWKEAQTLQPQEQTRHDALERLGYALSTRYNKTMQLSDIDEAIEYAQLSLKTARLDHPHSIVIALSQLSTRLYSRFKQQGNIEDRDTAIKFSELVMQTCPKDDPVQTTTLSFLCQAVFDKFTETGFWRDLEEAIRLAKLGFYSASETEYKLQFAKIAAIVLHDHYEQTKDFADLKESLEFSKEYVAITPHTHAVRGERLFFHLGKLKAFAKLVFSSSELDDLLDQALELIAPMPEGYPHEAINRRLLVDILSRRYELSGLPQDLVPLVAQAIGIGVDKISQEEARQRGTSLQDSGCLLGLFSKITELARHPLENNIVAQISGTFHQEYIKRIAELGPTRSLIDIEKNAPINAELVIVVHSPEDMGQLQEKVKEMFLFAQSMGAKTCQNRIKVPFLKVISDREKNGAEVSEREVLMDQKTTIDELEPLVVQFEAAFEDFNRTQMQCDLEKAVELGVSVADAGHDTPSTAAAHLTERPASGSTIRKTLLCLAQSDSNGNQLSITITSALSELAHALHLHAPTCDRGQDDICVAIQIAEAAVKLSDSAEFETVNLLSALPTPSGRRAADVEIDIVRHTIARSILAICLKHKYQYGGLMDDLNRGISILQKAIKLSLRVPVDARANHTVMVSRLGLMLRLRYQKLGNLQDLDVAIEMMETQIQEILCVGDGETPREQQDEILSNLGLVFSTRWTRTQSLEDCQQSVKYSKLALERMSQTSSLYSGTLMNLAISLHHQFTSTEDEESLNQSIEHATKAISLTDGRADNYTILVATSHILLDKFYIRKDESALQLAVEYAQRAVDAIPPNLLERASILCGLAEVLEAAQDHQPNDTIASRLLEVYTEVWASETDQLTTKIRAARKCAVLLVDGGRDEEALEIISDAIQLLADVAPRWMASHDRQHIVSKFTGMPSDAAAAHLQRGLAAAATSSISPKPVSGSWSRRIFSAAASRYLHRPSFLSRGPRRGKSRSSRSSKHIQAPELDLALQSSIYAALRCLELGRGVILGSSLDYRIEERSLQQLSPALCKDFNKICMELDSLAHERPLGKRSKRRKELLDQMKTAVAEIRTIPDLEGFCPPLALGSMTAVQLGNASPELFRIFNHLQQSLDSLPEGEDDDRQSKRQRELATELDSIVSKIRANPGLENFLLPLDLSSTLDLATNGPIIVISSSDVFKRSDAIIVQTNGLKAVPLPYLDHRDLCDWMDEFQDISRGWTLPNFSSKNKRMLQFLKWLWMVAVNPILTELGYAPAASSGKKPHVHWIGTGRLSGAPFHAAGDYTIDPVESAMDCVVSSYTPTLRALSYSRQTRDRQISPRLETPRFLIVSAPKVFGAAPLLRVPAEVSAIESIAESETNVVCLDEATADEVLRELPLANIVHFASHGVSDPGDLEASHLLLNGADMNDCSSSLTVRQIRAHKSPAAELAYLSACSAAENTSLRMADEGIHIASAFQVAGFRHVVGTMFQTKDEACTEVAERFYSALFHKNIQGTLAVADALHEAVEGLRKRYSKVPLVWVPFVHFGG